jgi:hypothetical protein
VCAPSGNSQLFGEAPNGLFETSHGSADDTGADLTNAGLTMGDAGIDGWRDSGIDD